MAAALSYIGAESRNVAIQNATGAALGTCPGRQPYDSTARGQVASLAGQLDSRRRAYEMVVAEEGRTNIRFSHVLYTRPDLSWPMPMWPYCLGFDLGRAMRKHDWVWLLPREPDARLALRDLPASFFACERSGDAVERFMFAG